MYGGIGMDKRKVITAYLRGFITIHECSQILGMDSGQVLGMVHDSKFSEPPRLVNRRPVNH
jgi:hypothetical protein